jgi:hypothetical protein
MIQTEKQYQFLYTIINNYLDDLNNRIQSSNGQSKKNLTVNR